MKKTAEEIEVAKKKATEAKERAVKALAERAKARDEAIKFAEDFRASGEKYVSLRIRDGFIGKELEGDKLQTERSRPRGTLVAIKGKNDKVYIGAAYKSNKDGDIPAVGIKLALERALKNRDEAESNGLIPSAGVKDKDKALYNFFKIRSMCYFFPELYSHSRGTNKVNYPNYDKIHENRKRALAYIGKDE
jgi:hypothetical protein